MVVRMRHTRGHTRNRRSHHALRGAASTVCQNCGARMMSHRACAACGKYNGREVVNVLARTTKKTAKKSARAKKEEHSHKEDK